MDADREVDALLLDRGQAAQLAGRDLGVLGPDGGGHVGRGQAVGVQPVGVEPDAHGVLGSEQGDLAHALHATQPVEDVGGHVVGQLRPVHGAVLGHETQDLHEVLDGLGDLHALGLHFLGQQGHGQLQLVLNLDLGDVGVGAGLEGQGDGGLARGLAGRGHIVEVVDALHLLLDDLGHRVFKRLGRRAGVGRADGHGRRGDGRVLRDGQAEDGQHAGQHGGDGQNPGEDRPVDEKMSHDISFSFRLGRAESVRAPAGPGQRGASF
ncbi:hypothetical protein DSECCO2_489730 [anaerobic digester metagenome]